MAIRDILVYHGNDPHNDSRMDIAISAAKRHGARLTGLHVLTYPALPTYMQVEVGREILEQQMAAQREKALAVEPVFLKRLSDAEVEGEWRLMEGDAIDAMNQSAHYADLTVVPQADPDTPTPYDNMADNLLMSSGRPLLIAPYIGAAESFGRRILVAWNASAQAARAVHDALPFLMAADEVVVQSVNPRDDSHLSGAEIGTHLARHDVKVEVKRIVAPDLDVGDALLSALSDNECDMLVMGGYGHSRIRELALGGATRQILQSMTAPVLMSH